MKYYNFEFILYEDSQNGGFVDTILKIKETICCYAYIKHDKDVNDDGSSKKTHYHLLVFFPTQHTISAVSKKLGVPEYQISIVKNKVGAIQYLIHKNDINKFQYDINDIITNIDIAKYFDNRVDSENQALYDMINYIDKSGYIFYRSFCNYVINNNYWSYYRRSAYMLHELIKEHNLYVDNNNTK